MGSLGYVIQAPEKEKYLMSKDELNAELVTLLAGRASEEIVFDSITTGAVSYTHLDVYKRQLLERVKFFH